MQKTLLQGKRERALYMLIPKYQKWLSKVVEGNLLLEQPWGQTLPCKCLLLCCVTQPCCHSPAFTQSCLHSTHQHTLSVPMLKDFCLIVTIHSGPPFKIYSNTELNPLFFQAGFTINIVGLICLTFYCFQIILSIIMLITS